MAPEEARQVEGAALLHHPEPPDPQLGCLRGLHDRLVESFVMSVTPRCGPAQTQRPGWSPTCQLVGDSHQPPLEQ